MRKTLAFLLTASMAGPAAAATLAEQLPASDMQVAQFTPAPPAAATDSASVMRANVPRAAGTGLVRAPLVTTFLGVSPTTAALIGATLIGAAAIAATQSDDNTAVGTGGTGSGSTGP